jgi:hypothetical protein
VAEGFTLSFQLFAYVVARGGAGDLRGGAGAVVVIIIFIVVPGNLVIRLHPISVEQTLLKPVG